jgi:hypothetical protein
MAEQPYTLENPEAREPTSEVVDEKVAAQVSPARPDFHLDLNGDEVTVSESYVQLDETVGPQDPNAVIVPPEGRGVHPDLGIAGKQTPEQMLASGDAPEGTGVVDGEVMTASEAEQKLADQNNS